MLKLNLWVCLRGRDSGVDTQVTDLLKSGSSRSTPFVVDLIRTGG